MRRWWMAIIVFAVAAIGAHFATVYALPGIIMDRAQAQLSERGADPYTWLASPQQTPQTQQIVRPSPDLSYAICLFDMADGAVLISAPAWEGYASLSVFDARTNNVFVTSLDGQDGRVLLHNPAVPLIEEGRFYLKGDEPVVTLKGKGLALIRRVAPGAQRHAAAESLIEESVCAPVNWSPGG
ncbi:MAG: DUF1254 domain-containing protein [Pseudomonadota bacterium]